MNRLLLVIGALTFSALSFASRTTASDLAGTYELRLSDEAVALCQLINAPLPQSKVVLTRDSRFRCEGGLDSSLGNEGTYAVKQDMIILYGKKTQKPFKASIRTDGLIFNGLRYERTCVDNGLSGDWHVVTSSGREDRSIVIRFMEDGTFSFKGMGGTSRGRYEVDGNCVYLDYKEVDGEPVEFDRRGRAVFTRDRNAFRIDNYWYERD